jgi:hypothetical protein
LTLLLCWVQALDSSCTSSLCPWSSSGRWLELRLSV